MSEEKKPKISIIIPAYQHAVDLAACLDSIFLQTFLDFEVIVVNDGSVDDTESVVQPYLDKIKYIYQENQGGNSARNKGFELAQADYLLFCDADIIMRPNCLQVMFDTLNNKPTASFAYCSFKYGWKKFKLWDYNSDILRKMNYIHTTSLIRREHFPGFDETVKKLQDWDLWLTMLENGHTGVWIPQVLFKAIPHRGGISTWMPGIFYRIPWNKFGLQIKAVEKFREAEKIMKEKHNLE